MPRRDYYLILGVPATESCEGIKSAFRALAQRYHPDRAGPRATPFFQEIVEAYRVLSDPLARASYDRGLRHGVGLAEEAARHTHAPRATGSACEPLVPDLYRPRHHRPWRHRPRFDVRLPPLEDLLGRVRDSFVSGPRARRAPEPLTLELRVSPEQALAGGAYLVDVPVYFPCPSCHGAIGPWRPPCPTCGSTGLVIETQRARVALPSGVRDGSVVELPVRGMGLHNLFLRVLVRVAS